MRLIKFRAWNGSRMVFCGKGGYADFIIEQGEVVEFGEFSRSDSKARDWPLMQYTGLKDKNGAEIYEGDIISWSPATILAPKVIADSWRKIETVEWNERFTGWFTKSSHYGIGLYGHNEVIGNIHQHPELLEQAA
jgi:uncharacterized phage protein (TIGR01671 family)